jgi:hypothetical protein
MASGRVPKTEMIFNLRFPSDGLRFVDAKPH